MVKQRTAKGFELDVEGNGKLGTCRDIRGFSAMLERVRDGAAPEIEPLVLRVPDLALDEQLDRWSTDTRSTHRRVAIVRRMDGKRIVVDATLVAYGFGVDTVIGAKLVADPAARTAPARSGVVARDDAPAAAPGPLRRRMLRG